MSLVLLLIGDQREDCFENKKRRMKESSGSDGGVTKSAGGRAKPRRRYEMDACNREK